MTQISADMALDIVRRAFFPLACGADIDTLEESMRIHVVNAQAESMLRLTGVTREEYSDTARLEALLTELREDLSGRFAIKLDPWQMPHVRILGN